MLRSFVKPLAGVGLLVGVVSLGVLLGGAGPADDEVPVAGPAVVITGPRSQLTRSHILLAPDQKIFDEAWKRHVDGTEEQKQFLWLTAPQIDFDKYQAIVIFGGATSNCRGYHVVETFRQDNERVIRYQRDSFQTAGGSIDASPWIVIVMPKVDGATVLEENTQGIIGGAPLWTRRGRFGK